MNINTIDNSGKKGKEAEKRLAWVVFENIKKQLLDVYKETTDFSVSRDVYKFLKEDILPNNINTKPEVLIYLKNQIQGLTYNNIGIRTVLLEKLSKLYPETKNF